MQVESDQVVGIVIRALSLQCVDRLPVAQALFSIVARLEGGVLCSDYTWSPIKQSVATPSWDVLAWIQGSANTRSRGKCEAGSPKIVLTATRLY